MGESQRSRVPRVLGRTIHAVAVVSLLAAVLVVIGVGSLAVVAQYINTWEWFFRMERVAALSVPVVVALLTVSMTSWLGVVYEASKS